MMMSSISVASTRRNHGANLVVATEAPSRGAAGNDGADRIESGTARRAEECALV